MIEVQEMTELFRRKQTNCLRGLAALLIATGHILIDWHAPRVVNITGSVGVAMFLVLSGYGINESYKKNGLNCRRTELFNNLKEYKEYLKKNPLEECNGVSQDFLDKHGISFEEYSVLNENNLRCWNCWECNNCTGCINCIYCKKCTDCRDCTECTSCIKCKKCKDCRPSDIYSKNFKDCENCENCIDCKKCIKCKNCENCSNCEKCENCKYCNYCISCKKCKVCTDCENNENIENCHVCKTRIFKNLTEYK